MGISETSPYFFVNVPSRKVGLQPVFGILVRIVVCQIVLLLHLIILIVTGIYHDRGMVAESLDLCHALHFDRLPDLWIGWVVAATEHEVLPDKDPKFVASVIEDVFFPDATTPNSMSRYQMGDFKSSACETYLTIT